MKRNVGHVLVIALLCGVSGTGCAPLGVGAAGSADAKAHAERLEQERRAASADAYMAHMHSLTVGTGSGLLPSRPFPLGRENYVDLEASVGADARGGPSTSTR